MSRFVTAAAVALALLAHPDPTSAAAPQTAAIAQPLSNEDKQDLQKIERYLNTLKSIRARFVQITDTGRYSEGKLFFVRPDRIRFEYEPPIQVLMIASGGWLNYYDGELKQTSKLPVSETPLGFLMRPQVSFGADVVVTQLERSAGVLRVEVVQSKDPGSGRLTLTFSREPLELRKWTIVDAQGMAINVALFNAESNTDIDAKLFEFSDPNFGKTRSSR